MTVLAVWDDIVEFKFIDDRNSGYLSVEDFLATYGREALYGKEIEIIECSEGTLYVC